jgi:rRNA maturation endonuclease Nob1
MLKKEKGLILVKCPACYWFSYNDKPECEKCGHKLVVDNFQKGEMKQHEK